MLNGVPAVAPAGAPTTNRVAPEGCHTSVMGVAVAPAPAGGRPYMSSMVRSTLKWSILSLYEPGTTTGPTKSVGIWFDWLESSSSKVRMSRLLCVWAHWTYELRLSFSHASLAATLPSCMSCCRSGTTKETVGSFVKSDGKSEKGRLSLAGIALAGASCQSCQGLCRLA